MNLLQQGEAYAVPVRQASVLLTASFGFGLATNTLAVRLALPLAGCALDFDQRVSAPCQAYKGETGPFGPVSRVDRLKTPKRSLTRPVELRSGSNCLGEGTARRTRHVRPLAGKRTGGLESTGSPGDGNLAG